MWKIFIFFSLGGWEHIFILKLFEIFYNRKANMCSQITLYSFTHSFIYTFIHSFLYPLIYSFYNSTLCARPGARDE